MSTIQQYDVNSLDELPPLPKGQRYFDFIGGSKEFRCYVVPEDLPRNKFMAEHEKLFDDCLTPIYQHNGIVIKQDASFALPGFYIVSHTNHYHSLDEIDEVTHLRLFYILREIRLGMRERLGIQNIHIYYEERTVASHNVHYWMVPIYDTEKYPRIYNFDIKKYLDQFLFSQNGDKIRSCNMKMKEYIQEIDLLHKDEELTKVLKTFHHSTSLSIQAPATVDCNITGRCNLSCAWCWGPDHQAKEELSKEQWKKLAHNLKKSGTNKITITGGEPLLRNDLSEILKYLHDDLGLYVTLSTNGILLQKQADKILPYIDDIGMPLDGHTNEVQNLMRCGAANHCTIVTECLQMVQQQFPSIDVTVRTVVSQKNAEFVPEIGETMIQAGIDPTRIRWKLYQATPLGLRKKDILTGNWVLSSSDFEEVVNKTKKRNPTFSNISVLTTDMHVGRYFHIYPNGNAHVFIQENDGFPAPFSIGNIEKDFYKVLQKLEAFDLTNNDIR